MIEKAAQTFKYKELNSKYIEKYYNKKMLGLSKDAMPMFSSNQL
jgi:hypothetical protein